MEIGKGKYIFGIVKVGERGQIVIPKEAREKFDIKPGDSLLVLGDENKGGIALVKADLMKGFALKILEGLGQIKETFKEDRDSS
jgi:AbrB family looped-hinge helix DNA binding protein